ncbi:MAG TPA: hypothetical protein VFH43_14915 [Candidatus Kapabacteria bacterium]|nr:hypothetical protein [Candidatus Kapabacteria bacterium]
MSPLHVELSMPIAVFILVLFFASTASAQELSPGKLRLKEVMEFQAQLKAGNTSLMDVRERWMLAAKDPAVKKERDALAIAYASRATVERDLGNVETADSLFTLAMPIFELKSSKAFFLLSHANLKKLNGKPSAAIELFGELATEFDSLPQLKDIKFYAKSGYAELAYAIDASRQITLLAMRNAKLQPAAIKTLNEVAKKHPNDQLGLMALIGLGRLDPKNAKSIEARKNKLIEKNRGFDALATEFARQFD